MKKKRENKYGARKTIVDGVVFDSKKESKRYCELKLLLKAGAISCLKLQPKFLLLDGFRHKGKAYRAVHYIADFQYVDMETGDEVVEDVKSKATKTPIYQIKKKLFLFHYGDRFIFREIEN